jgi:hypothetical protein
MALLVACGSGNSGTVPLTGRAVPSKHHEEASQEEGSPGRAAAPPEPPTARCIDGTCFPCGGGYCPNGFYCDENTKGGAACSWLVACAKGATCNCVTRALGSCTCSVEGGGAHVRCE